jgi:hypothetical protein
MLRKTRTIVSTISVLSILVLVVAPLVAQDNRAAGLFTTARDLPLVSQSLVVTVTDYDAVLELVQVFANDGADVGQADYRLPLPDGATVTGYGFWQDGIFLAAELKGKAVAVAAHQKAASEGRATALSSHHGGRTQSFSVYPVLAGELKQVEVTLRLPVVTEEGRNHLRLPVERFLGRSPVSSTIVVHLETAEPLYDFGIDDAAFQVTRLESRAATLALAVDRPVELWWAEQTPPFLARAEVVPVGDGVLAWQLRLAFREEDTEEHEQEIVVLIDGSSSLRRRAAAVGAAVERILTRATIPIRVIEVGTDAFSVSWDDLVAAAAVEGCESPARRCIALTDPQVQELPTRRDESFEPLFLADSDELVQFSVQLGPKALTWDTGAEARGKLRALVDELVRPVLVVEELEQHGGTAEVLGGQRLRVAAGGYLRVFGFTHSEEPLNLTLNVAGAPRRVTVELAPLVPDDPRAVALRREVFRLRLAEWLADFRRNRDPELRQQIIDLSLREGIPTPVTAFQVSGPDVLPRGGTAGPVLRLLGLLLLVAAFILGFARRPLCL